MFKKTIGLVALLTIRSLAHAASVNLPEKRNYLFVGVSKVVDVNWTVNPGGKCQ